MRLTCTLALACLLASCALPPPPVATVVEDESTKPVVVKNTMSQPAAAEATPLPAGQRSLMKTNPDMIARLPDRRDFQPTAPPQTTADRGPNLMVPAPKPPPSE